MTRPGSTICQQSIHSVPWWGPHWIISQEVIVFVSGPDAHPSLCTRMCETCVNDSGPCHFFLRLCHIETCLCACLKINTSASRAQGRAAAFFPPSSSGLCLRRSPASFMYLHSHNGGSEISACASAIRNLHAFLTYMDISLQVQGGSVPLPSSTCISGYSTEVGQTATPGFWVDERI